MLVADWCFERRSLGLKLRDEFREGRWVENCPRKLMGAYLSGFLDYADRDIAELLSAAPFSHTFAVRCNQVGEVQSTSEAGWPGAYQQHIHFQRFAFARHSVES